jgi:MATE family multidrug resistance protein
VPADGAPRDGGIRQMLAIALPMVVSQACDTVMIFTDRLFLSRLGPELMSAAMGGGLTSFMMMSFFIGLTGYSTALAAQYFGAGKKSSCAVVASQAFLFSFIAYIPILASAPLAHALFKFMGISPVQLGPQKIYFNILLYGTIISLLRINLGCFFSGIGRTRIVMTASITAMIANIFFNYILVFGKLGFPAMGIKGSAVGTILGGVSGLAVLLFAYFGKRVREEFLVVKAFRFDKVIAKQLLRFGTPAGLEMFLTILAFNGMVLIFHSHSVVTATAATIVFNWDLVSFVPLLGMEIGVTSMVGRFMGAGSPEKAHGSAMSAFKIGMVYSAIVFAFFVFFTPGLVNMFRPDIPSPVFEAAFPLAVFMIRMAAIYVTVEAMLVIFIGALRGAGDTVWPMAVSVSIHWVMVGLLLFIMKGLCLSPEVGWVSVVVLFVFFSVIVFMRYAQGKWKNIKVIEEPVPVVSDSFHEPADI